MKDKVTWRVILNFERTKGVSEDDANKKPEDASYMVDVLKICKVHKDEVSKKTIRVLPLKEPGVPAVISIPISQIDSLSSIRLVIPKNLLPVEARENTLKKVCEVVARFAKEGMPLLDPEDDMQVQSSSYKKSSRRIEALESLFQKHEITNSPLVEQKLKVLHSKERTCAHNKVYNGTKKIKSIKKSVRNSSVVAFKEEFKAWKRVLGRLGYITRHDVVELKGKVACEISSADELTLTELMFNGVLNDIKDTASKVAKVLDLLFMQLQDTASKVAKVQLECKVQIDVETFASSFRPDVMEAVYAWAKGSKFYEIMEMTPFLEESLIRAIPRLEELQQLKQPF